MVLAIVECGSDRRIEEKSRVKMIGAGHSKVSEIVTTVRLRKSGMEPSTKLYGPGGKPALTMV